MVVELLTMWGVKTAWSAFGPALEDLAKDAAKDGAKSYIGKCFGSVFSAASREPLTKGAGRMVKELLDLLEYELGLDEDTEAEELILIRRAVDAFLDQAEVQQAIIGLLQGEQLDSAVLAQAWQDIHDAPELPKNAGGRISFNKKARKSATASPELKAIFAQNAAVKAHEALASNLDRYHEALQERFGRLNLDCLDTDGASYSVSSFR